MSYFGTLKIVDRLSEDCEDMPVSVVTKYCRNTWCGFRIVGDNIDKNVHRSFQ